MAAEISLPHAAGDHPPARDSEDLGQGDAVGEVGIHRTATTPNGVGHQRSSNLEYVFGIVMRVVVVR
ncbi:MAG TPA: hypothetical protein VJ851_07905 [Jatrophihabitans sp.]|nr:hypothetical protein [Jatrophihabitans sp.]